jgi:hypothetical protein
VVALISAGAQVHGRSLWVHGEEEESVAVLTVGGVKRRGSGCRPAVMGSSGSGWSSSARCPD